MGEPAAVGPAAEVRGLAAAEPAWQGVRLPPWPGAVLGCCPGALGPVKACPGRASDVMQRMHKGPAHAQTSHWITTTSQGFCLRPPTCQKKSAPLHVDGPRPICKKEWLLLRQEALPASHVVTGRRPEDGPPPTRPCDEHAHNAKTSTIHGQLTRR